MLGLCGRYWGDELPSRRRNKAQVTDKPKNVKRKRKHEDMTESERERKQSCSVKDETKGRKRKGERKRKKSGAGGETSSLGEASDSKELGQAENAGLSPQVSHYLPRQVKQL